MPASNMNNKEDKAIASTAAANASLRWRQQQYITAVTSAAANDGLPFTSAFNYNNNNDDDPSFASDDDDDNCDNDADPSFASAFTSDNDDNDGTPFDSDNYNDNNNNNNRSAFASYNDNDAPTDGGIKLVEWRGGRLCNQWRRTLH